MKKHLLHVLLLFVSVSCTEGIQRRNHDADVDTLKDSVLFYKNQGKELRNTARYKDALAAHEKGLELAQYIEDTLEIVQALNNIGTVYRRMGLLEEAASWHYKALNYCDRWSDQSSPTSLKNRVISLNGIGNIHLSMGNDDLAMAAFREALKGESKLGSATGQAINHANIGAIFEERHQLDSAAFYYRQSLMFNESSGNQLGVALCKNHFGRLAEMQEDYNEAFKNYKAAYDLLKNGKDKWHLLQASVSLTRICLVQEKYQASEHYSDEALVIAKEIGSLAHLTDIYHQKYRLHRKLGNYRSALTWLEKASEHSDSLAHERNEKEVYNLRTSYEREKNQLEVAHIQKMHQEDTRRKNMILMGVVVILILAILIICAFAYVHVLRAKNYKILQDLEKTKDNYFTNIAHEFRTPLTVILSAARSINETAIEDVAVQEDSKDIINHSTELLNLVNQVLDVAKMTSAISPSPVWRNGNIVSFVSGICERYSHYAKEKNISLTFETNEDVVQMDFVPDFMLRTVQNLLSNALKFTPKNGSVKVLLYVERNAKGDRLHISVSDTGVGMHDHQLNEIFKPFYSGAGEMGTGVGLAVVKLSVEAMYGSVDVRSQVGKGSEFIVTLPVRNDKSCGLSLEEESQSEEVIASFAPAENMDKLEDDAPRILIVEDKPEVARWEMRHLDSGYAFYFASDGAQALQKAEEIVPDLIITDVMMPVMDGLEFCRKVRSSELLCHIPVVMVTAKAEHEDRLKGLEAGADAYLEKPYDEKELSTRVRMLLEQRAKMKQKFTGAHVQSEESYSAVDKAFMDKFDLALDSAFDSGKVDCEALASELCIGRVQLNRKLKAITGLKTTEYILRHRIAKAKELLATTDISIGDVAMRCGIDDVGYFSTLFRKNVGVVPSVYRKQPF